MSHYYKKDGTPCHDVPNASKPGTTRPTTKRDAKKLGLYPSVTTIDKAVLANMGIIDYRISQTLLASLTLPRLPGEKDDDFALRVMEDAKQHMNDAMDFGTRIHNAVEIWLKHKMMPADKELEPYMLKAREWLDANVEEVGFVERTMVGEAAGYAGTIDLYASIKGYGWGIWDFKTRTPDRKSGRFNSYPSDIRQIAAYRAIAEENGLPPGLKGGNILIDSSKPAHPVVKEHDETKLRAGLQVFGLAFEIWCLDGAGYDPRKNA